MEDIVTRVGVREHDSSDALFNCETDFGMGLRILGRNSCQKNDKS